MDLLQGSNQSTENQAQEQAPEAQQATDSSQPEQPQTFLEYGERKFTSKDEVIKKMEHADKYIEEKKQREQELQAEVDRLQQELQKAKKLEDAMQELQHTPKETQQGGNTNQPPASVDKEGLTKEILEAIRKEREQETVKAEREKNLATSHQAATAKYGSAYMDKLVQEASSRGLDLNQQDIIDLASRKPATFSELFGLQKQSKPSVAPTKGQQVSSQPQANTTDKSFKGIAQRYAEQNGIEYDPSMHSLQKAGGFKR